MSSGQTTSKIVFKVVWDKYNTVRLTMASMGEALNVSPRPVFYEELNLLGLDKKGWRYPESKKPLMWACDRRYFYNGELVMEVKGGNIFDAPTVNIIPGKEYLDITPVDMDYLHQRNEDSLFLLEHEAMDFINQTYRRYKGLKTVTEKNPDLDFQQLADHLEKKTKEKHVVVKEDCDSFDIMPLSEAEAQGKAPILSSKVDLFISSFSGGKDSQVVLDLCARVIPSEDFLVIYSDTGYELPTSLLLYEETKKYYSQAYPTLRFYTAKNHQSVLQYWDKMGAPSRIHRWCCSVMKSAPLNRLIKDIYGQGKQPTSVLVDGVRAEESVSRASRSRIGKNVKHNNVINISPILDWNSTEVYLYLLLRDLPFNRSYRHGLSRVGCVICPYSSGWSEDLCGQLYPETVEPFVDRLRSTLSSAKVSGVENYIKEGKWKMRAGGRDVPCEASMNIVSVTPDLQFTIQMPRENILTWMRVLGENKYYEDEKGEISGDIRYQKTLIRFSLTDSRDGNIVLTFYNVGNDIIMSSRIKKVVYKSVYCIHCEVCEVECPTGALSVAPRVRIDKDKCVHCMKCLDFDGKGCWSASSVSASFGETINKPNMKSSKSGINRYNDGMGLRDIWLSKYFSSSDSFFDNDDHGLNIRYQIPPFTNWIREACILNSQDKSISETGKLLQFIYQTRPKVVWEIIFINLCENSEICSWFFSSVGFNRFYTRAELDVILQESYPELKDRTLKNPLNSLINTFKESPLGTQMKIANPVIQDKKVGIKREPYNEISSIAVAYSLYKYAEKQGRRSLTVSEFYNDSQTEGIYRQFGVDRVSLEKILRSLQEESHQVLTVELNMGLDNINLRDDLTSFDVLKALL